MRFSGQIPPRDTVPDMSLNKTLPTLPLLAPARPVAKVNTQGKRDWFRIENASARNTSVIYIYDEIGYWGTTAADFVARLAEVDSRTIELHINSPGGDVFEGVAIYNALRDHSAEVNVIVDALAASAASLIAMAGDTITMNRNSEMMIHDAWGVCVGNAEDMATMATLLGKASDNIASVYAARAGGTLSEWRDAMREESWFSSDEAVTAGLADKSVTNEDEAAVAAVSKWDLSMFQDSGRIAAMAEIPASNPPAAEPADSFAVDAADFVSAVSTAVEDATADFEFDAETFLVAISAAAMEAHAPTPPDVVVVGPAASPTEAPAAAPVDREPTWPELFRAAVSLAASDAPAPTPSIAPQKYTPSGSDVREAIQEAIR